MHPSCSLSTGLSPANARMARLRGNVWRGWQQRSEPVGEGKRTNGRKRTGKRNNRQGPRESNGRAVSPGQAEARSRSADKDNDPDWAAASGPPFPNSAFPRPTFLDAAPASDVAHPTALPRPQLCVRSNACLHPVRSLLRPSTARRLRSPVKPSLFRDLQKSARRSARLSRPNR